MHQPSAIGDHPEGLELLAHESCADTENSPTTRQCVEGCPLFGHQQWLAIRQHQHARDTFDRRGLATDEAIRLLRTVWAGGAEVSFTGEVYRFKSVRFLPKPVRPGGTPIWVGGNGRRSIRRAAELGDGWHPVRIGVNELRAGVATLHELLDRNRRQSPDVTISGKFRLYSPSSSARDEPHESEMIGPAELIAEKIRTYQDAGLQYLILDPTHHKTSSEAIDAIDFFAHEVQPLLD